jgi:AraC-like DNA-binding protein
VAGGDQVLRRSAAASRYRPSDLLKVCIQRAGTATIAQGGREVRLTPGSMTIYDIDQPYLIALQGEWRCSVIAFPRSAVAASRLFVDRLICRPVLVTDGPGAVLAPLVAAAVARTAEPGAASALVGRASVDLVLAALAEQHRPETADAVRLQIDAWIRAHLAEPGLCHARVAAAHHMSGRTLHRLFSEPGPTVTELIRGYRLDRILADLRSPAAARDSISQVAARWGVHDMPHFSRAFRARYGMTPSQARQNGSAAGQPGRVDH